MNTDGMSVIAKRESRQERRERTRAELLAAARRAFLREGFHAASLDAIAEEAGYTKGAFYSNFASKDDVLVAVLEEHFRDRAEAYESLVSSAETIEDAYGAVARFWHDANEREPEWSRLVIEFMAHASRNEKLRQAVREVRERGLDRIARIVERLAEGHGVEYTIPISELVRGSGALNRGLAVEQLLDPGLSVEAFEEMHVAFIRGLTKEKRRTKEQP
jgi:AcrR family transcriptional regulator